MNFSLTKCSQSVKLIFMSEVFSNWRTEKNLSQEQAAAMLGLSKSMISMLENGRRKPSSEKRIEIENITNGQVSYKDW